MSCTSNDYVIRDIVTADGVTYDQLSDLQRTSPTHLLQVAEMLMAISFCFEVGLFRGHLEKLSFQLP